MFGFSLLPENALTRRIFWMKWRTELEAVLLLKQSFKGTKDPFRGIGRKFVRSNQATRDVISSANRYLVAPFQEFPGWTCWLWPWPQPHPPTHPLTQGSLAFSGLIEMILFSIWSPLHNNHPPSPPSEILERTYASYTCVFMPSFFLSFTHCSKCMTCQLFTGH